MPPDDLLSDRFLRDLQVNLGPALGPWLLAMVAAAALTAVLIVLGPRLGFVAYPGRERDIHTRPTPLLGGVALYAGFAAAALVFLGPDPSLLGVLGLGGAAVAIYALDDRLGMPAPAKLGVQVALAVAAVEVFGLRIDALNLGTLSVRDLGLFVLPVTVAWIVGMQNTINLLDGVDGLAAGVVAIVAVVLMISVFGRPEGLPTGQQRQVLVLTAGLAGACVGFLLFNFHPARIFMGDAGSQFLGLALALLSILSVAKVAAAAALVVPLLALAVPIADTAWAIVRRRRRGVSITHADSRHIHHHLLDFGLSQRETCLLFYGATGILGALGLSLLGHRRTVAAAVVLMVVILSTLLGERLRLWNRRVPVPGGRLIRLFLEGKTGSSADSPEVRIS